ncbi:MAG: translocation/assembly module TamB domain-containing protein [Desulfobaccales bacterium]
MRLLKRIALALLVVLLLSLAALWGFLRSETFWRWAGGKMVALAQSECNCDVRVAKITGNLFDGLFFNDFVFTTCEGEVIRGKSVELQMSFWSILALRPEFRKIAVLEPHFTIRRERDGEWNIIKILPPPPTSLPVNITALKFPNVLIIDGDGIIYQEGGNQTFTNFDLEMTANLVNPVTPRQVFNVGKAIGSATTPFGRVRLSNRFTYKTGFFEVDHLEVKAGEKTVLSLTGKADLNEGGQFQATGRLDLPSQAIHKAWEKWPPAWDAHAKFQVAGTRSQLQIDLKGKVHETSFDVAGSLNPQADSWNYDLQGYLKNLSPNLLEIFDAALVKKLDQLGPLNVKFKGQGTENQLSWGLDSDAFQYGSAKVDKLKLSLTGDRQNQQLQGTAASNVGQLSLNASGALFSAREGKFSFQAEAFKPKPLGLAVPEGTVLTATLDGTFSSPGIHALDRGQVSMTMAASGKIGPHPLKDVHACLTWSRDKLDIPQADIQLGNLKAELTGVMVGDTLNFSHAGKSTPGGDWPIPARLGGQFSWEGKLTGSRTDPQVSLKANGRSLSFEEFGLQTVNLNLQTSGWPPAKGRVDFQASGVKTPAGVFSQVSFRGEGSGKLWNYDLKAAGPEGARLEARGGADFGRSLVSAERLLFQVRKITVQNLGPVEISLASGLEVKPAAFQVNKGRVGLEARITGQQVAGRLDLQNLSAELVAPRSYPLTGTITGEAVLSGQARLPIIQGRVGVGPGRYREFDFQAFSTAFTYRDNQLSLDGSLQSKDSGPSLNWSGQVPLRLSLMPLSYALGQEGMRLLLRGDNINLSLLPSFSNTVESAQGVVNLLAKIEGSPKQPQVSGQVSWGPSAIKLRPTGATYQLQPGEIRLQENRLTIPPLTLQNEGTLTLTGNITLAGFLPDEVRARVQADNFKALDKPGLNAFLSGVLNLDGRWPDLALKGNLTIPKAQFRLSFLNLGTNNVNKDIVLVREEGPVVRLAPKTQKGTDGKEPAVWRNLTIDVNVQAPKNVWVDDRAAKIELAVDARVKKQPGQELAYVGKVQALEGRVMIVGREFQVTRGVITLPSQPEAEPVLDARIEYETNEVTLYANAAGPVSTPKITLGGEPAVSETDWMAYLLYGRPVGALSREEQSAVSAAGVFGGLATQKILKDLLGMAPPLTKGLTITYQQRNDPLYRDDPYQVVINYRINRRFSVQSQVGGRNTGGDVLFNYDF